MYGTSLIVSAHPYTFLNKVVSAYQIQPQTENNFCAEVEVSVDHVPRCISKAIKSFLEPSAAWGRALRSPLAHRSGAAADYTNRPNYKENSAKRCTPLSVSGLPSRHKLLR